MWRASRPIPRCRSVSEKRDVVPGTGTFRAALIPGASSGDSFNLFFSTGLADFPFSAILSILSQEGLAKMLAEPTLVAMSVRKLNFTRRELPILVSQQLGQVSMEFKKFGVRLYFTQRCSRKGMTLKLGVEVSEPDASAGVVVGGFQVPGFKMRSSETTIRLRDGQSLRSPVCFRTRCAPSSARFRFSEISDTGHAFRSTAYQRKRRNC